MLCPGEKAHQWGQLQISPQFPPAIGPTRIPLPILRVRGSLGAPESGSLRAPDHLEHHGITSSNKSGSLRDLRAPENETFRRV